MTPRAGMGGAGAGSAGAGVGRSEDGGVRKPPPPLPLPLPLPLQQAWQQQQEEEQQEQQQQEEEEEEEEEAEVDAARGGGLLRSWPQGVAARVRVVRDSVKPTTSWAGVLTLPPAHWSVLQAILWVDSVLTDSGGSSNGTTATTATATTTAAAITATTTGNITKRALALPAEARSARPPAPHTLGNYSTARGSAMPWTAVARKQVHAALEREGVNGSILLDLLLPWPRPPRLRGTPPRGQGGTPPRGQGGTPPRGQGGTPLRGQGGTPPRRQERKAGRARAARGVGSRRGRVVGRLSRLSWYLFPSLPPRRFRALAAFEAAGGFAEALRQRMHVASAAAAPSQALTAAYCIGGLLGSADDPSARDVCCPRACGVCGGDGCSTRPGGRWCCRNGIERLRRSIFVRRGEKPPASAASCRTAVEVGCIVPGAAAVASR